MSKYDNEHAPLALTLNISPSTSRLAVIMLASFITLLIYLLASNPARVFENKLGSLGWQLNPSTELEERLVIIAIDEKSLAQLGPWPWPRHTMAQLTEALQSAGVNQQLYDIVFPEAKPGDMDFITALQKTNSIIAQIPILQSDKSLQTGKMTHHFENMRCPSHIPTAQSYLASHASFDAISKGHITPTIDTDGSIRTIPPLICINNKVYPTLAISALLASTNSQWGNAILQKGSTLLHAPWAVTFTDYPNLSIPLDADGMLRINYHRSPASFQVVSAVDVLNKSIDPLQLDGTWALIGATAFGLGDVVPTPHSGLTPGVEIQARLISNMLDDQLLYTPILASPILAGLGIAWALILYTLASSHRTKRYSLLVAGVFLPIVSLVIHIQLTSLNLWLGWFYPALFSVLAAALLSLLEHTRTHTERVRIFNNLNSYLPQNVANEIAFNLPSGTVEAERKELVLLCADLRNFSSFEESRPPEEPAALLHCFFIHATNIIEQYGGNIHELRGDSVLATWSTESGSTSTEKALQAAISLQEMIKNILPTSLPAGLEPLALGISIEQGPTLVGSIGPAHRRTHTLLGDTVTLTLRIQELTQELAQPILIGECAARHLTGCDIQSQGVFLLNGLRIPHTLFAPIPPEADHIPLYDDEKPVLKVITGGRH